MMNVRYQLSAPIALFIIAAVSLTTGVLLIHAINSVDFTGISEGASVAAGAPQS